LCFIFFGLNGTVAAQGRLNMDRFQNRITNEKLLEGVKRYEAEGTPFLQEEFVTGEIYANDGKATGIPLRYNIYEDQMEFKQGEATFILRAEKSVDKVMIGVAKFVVEKYPYKGKAKVGYLQQLDSGKVSLYTKKTVSLSQPQEPSAMSYEIKPAKFSRNPDTFYYKVGDGDLVKVENVKKLIASLPNNKDAVSKFAKDNGISSKEDELARLVKFYNSL